MTRTSKLLAVPLAALVLFGTLAASTKEAEARRWHRGYGYGIGFGAAALFTAAAIAAASAPRCETVAVYNRRGQVIGYRDICG